jgi:predicted dehydrogenase
MLRVGFAGTGLIAWAHGLGVKAMIDAGLVDAELAAAFDPDPQRLAGFSDFLDLRPCSDLGAVLEDCDVLWICSPTAPHLEIAAAAVEAGKAIFCEKPLAPDLDRAIQLTDLVDGSGLPAQAGLVLRSVPVCVMLRDIISSGEFGPVMTAVLRDDQYFPTQGRYASSWRSDETIAGGGCLIEHSIHDVDILRFCFGEIAEVAARTSNHAGHRGIEDVANLQLVTEAGTPLSLISVWHGVLTRGSGRRVEVFTERAYLWLENDFRGPIHIETSDGHETRECPSPAWVYDLSLTDDEIGLAIAAYVVADRGFLDAVSFSRPPDPALVEALIAHRIVDAAYRSADAGGVPLATPAP